MIHRGLRTAPFLVILLFVVGSTALAFSPDQSWVYDAIERLKTLGIMPLWAGTVRPIPAAHLREALEVATRRAETRHVSPADIALLDRLRAVADLRRPTIQVDAGPTRFALARPSAIFTGRTDQFEWVLGASSDGLTDAGANFSIGRVGLFLGRSRVGWGPAGDGGLLFSDRAAGIDRIQGSLNWANVRLRKFVGLLDGDRSIVGTRLDIPFRPTLRFGFAESIIMAGVPYWGYILNPVPFLVSQYLEQQLRPQSGDNQTESADVEWLIRPGLRVFAEIVVDDLTAPTPTANYPSRLGLTAGIHRAHESGFDFRASYAIVTNWTYTQYPGDHVLRGIPLAHPIGNDFDLLHVRWNRSLETAILWSTIIRKGEGRIGVAPSSDVEARQFWFLRGVVEYSIVGGADFRFSSSTGWAGTIGPWAAYRANAGHVPGATRIDWGISVVAGRTF